MKVFKYHEFVRILKCNGYVKVRKNSHEIWKNKSGRSIPIANNRKFSNAILNRLIKEYDLVIDE